jgi:PAS domain S-box-containing protein
MDSNLQRYALRFATVVAVAALVVGGFVLAGHVFGFPELGSFLKRETSMKANTALGFVCLALGQLLVLAQESAAGRPGARRLLHLSTLVSLAAALIGALTVSEFQFDWIRGFDSFLLQNSALPVDVAFSGRMSPESAVCLLLLGLSRVFENVFSPRLLPVMLSAFFNLMVVSLSLSSLSTHFPSVFGVFNWLGSYVVAESTATIFILLGISGFVVACSRDVHSWSLGKAATTGFALGSVLLISIGVTATRAQYLASEANSRLVRTETLYAKCANMLSDITQQQSHILSFLLTDNLRFLNAGLVVADFTRLNIDDLRRNVDVDDKEAQRYLVFEERILELLTWSERTVATSRAGINADERDAAIKQGNDLLNKARLDFAQLGSEHQQLTRELKRQSEHVRNTSFLITTLGMLASLAIFVIVMLHVNRLIRERHRVKRELIESEQQYRTLADSGNALIWTAGTDKRCNYFNKAWLRFTGRAIEQELGDGWVEGVHPDDRADCIAIYAQAFDVRERFSMDYRLLRNDGEYRWVQDDGGPRFDSAGNFIGYIGYCLDITERKQAQDAVRESELRFRKLLQEVSSVAVQSYGPDLTVRYWNDASTRLFGFMPEEAVGRKLTGLIIPDELIGTIQEDVASMVERL